MDAPALPPDLHPRRPDVLAVEAEYLADAIQRDQRHAADEGDIA